jgi:hypothetical protein
MKHKQLLGYSPMVQIIAYSMSLQLAAIEMEFSVTI